MKNSHSDASQVEVTYSGFGGYSARVIDHLGRAIDSMSGPFEDILAWSAEKWPGVQVVLLPAQRDSTCAHFDP